MAVIILEALINLLLHEHIHQHIHEHIQQHIQQHIHQHMRQYIYQPNKVLFLHSLFVIIKTPKFGINPNIIFLTRLKIINFKSFIHSKKFVF